MTARRRDFNRQLLALGGAASLGSLGGLAPQGAQAQSAFVDGRDFRRVETPAATPATGKIDVVEFFMYSCPHCHAFDPALDAWAEKLPADVSFRRVPAVFGALPEAHAKMFYALEAMGQLEKQHKRIFAAMHIQRRRLDKPEDMAAFMAEGGVDRAAFLDAFNGFGTATKVRQGKQLADAYRIDGVPTLGIHGRWVTSGSMAGTNERALLVANQLIGQVRASGVHRKA
jgi:protein dithiol oxidoreductase (disulfide-forming)